MPNPNPTPITIPGIGTHSARDFALLSEGEAVLIMGRLEEQKFGAPDYICEAYDIEEKVKGLTDDTQIVVCVGHIRTLLNVINGLEGDIERLNGARR